MKLKYLLRYDIYFWYLKIGCSIGVIKAIYRPILNGIDFEFKVNLEVPDFGSDSKIYSSAFCQFIFEPVTLNKIGVGSLCKINYNFINVEILFGATINIGDDLHLKLMKIKCGISEYFENFPESSLKSPSPSFQKPAAKIQGPSGSVLSLC